MAEETAQRIMRLWLSSQVSAESFADLHLPLWAFGEDGRRKNSSPICGQSRAMKGALFLKDIGCKKIVCKKIASHALPTAGAFFFSFFFLQPSHQSIYSLCCDCPGVKYPESITPMLHADL